MTGTLEQCIKDERYPNIITNPCVTLNIEPLIVNQVTWNEIQESFNTLVNRPIWYIDEYAYTLEARVGSKV